MAGGVSRRHLRSFIALPPSPAKSLGRAGVEESSSAIASGPVLRHGGIVIGQRRGEAVVAVIGRDKVEVADRSRISGGADGGKARTGDRSWRKPEPTVCVEGRFHLEVVTREALPLLAHCVLDRRI